MVSRRNFISICVMMATILILFQFSILSRDFVNNYNKNTYLNETELTRTDAWSGQLADGTVQTVLYIGSEDDAEAGIIRQWCGYTKRQFAQCGSLEDYSIAANGGPVLLCLNKEAVAADAQVDKLSALVQNGQNVLFCNAPESALLTDMPALRTLLGIREVVQEQAELAGIRLFSGFLLGGEAIYLIEEEEEKLNQEISISAPWYSRLSGTKSYMVGMLEDEDIDNEYLPSLIWRNSYGSGRVFVVNGTYMQDETGLGILSAIMYELQDYDLYPVVNAQNLSIANFPDFASENTEELMGIYSRDLLKFQRDLMWPGLISATNKGNYKITGFMTPRLDYSVRDSLSADELTFYLKQFNEQNAEAGLSLDHLPGISLKDKLYADQAFFDSSDAAYSYGSAYLSSEEMDGFLAVAPQGILKNIRTVTGVWDDADLLYYCSNTVVAQGVTADGFTHPYLQDLRVRAVETSLGYSNILLDMKRISWPEEDDLHWEVLSDRFSSNINTYWKQFSVFDKTTLLESDERIRDFFALDYRDAREADTVTVEITNGGGDNWFILRTHAETIRDIVGGDFVEIEEDVYLIHATEKNLQIELEERRNKQYFLP